MDFERILYVNKGSAEGNDNVTFLAFKVGSLQSLEKQTKKSDLQINLVCFFFVSYFFLFFNRK